MNTIKTIIVDDEPLARERIRELIKFDSEIEIVGECSNGEEAVEKINEINPDLIFLDIQMPKLSGFEVIANLNRIPAVIFVTAYDKYAIRAFELKVLDYLLKPFDKERFFSALNRAKEKLLSLNDNQITDKIDSLLKYLEEKKEGFIERFVIKSSGRIYFVSVEEIDWFEADGNYVILHIGNKTELIRDTIKNIESKLDQKKFVRVHRSSIIRINSIKELIPWFGNEYKIKLKNGNELLTGKKYKSNINNLIK